MDIKKAEFAGSWYPASARECEQKIQTYLDFTLPLNLPEKEYLACISPHAGWYFSGSIACNVIHLLKGNVSPDLIIVFGKHMSRNSPASILVNTSCETPFGNIMTDDDFTKALLRKIQLRKERGASFAPENTIELQLPFIKYFFKDVKIAVVGVPPGNEAAILGATTIEVCKEMGKNVKIIGSTDMTHYGENFGFTPAGRGQKAANWVKNENDRKMIEAMIIMDSDRILMEAYENQNACCSGAVSATVSAARALGVARGEKIAYASSNDLSPGDSFVGYAGIVY